MKKKIKDCTYKEVREYNKNNVDQVTSAVLAFFHSWFQRNEHSWSIRLDYEFPRIFNESVMNHEIDVDNTSK